MHGLVMQSSCVDLLEIESDSEQRRSNAIAYVPVRRKAQAVCARQTAVERIAGLREPMALSAFSRLPRAYPGFGNRVLRLIGVGAGVGQKWIAITSAATTGGHRLTLLQCLKAAGAHSGSDVLAAILAWARRRRRRHRKISQRE
jgi:hypothetical protein